MTLKSRLHAYRKTISPQSYRMMNKHRTHLSIIVLPSPLPIKYATQMQLNTLRNVEYSRPRSLRYSKFNGVCCYIIICTGLLLAFVIEL